MDVQNGYGEESFPNGDKFYGKYCNGIRTGKGKIVWADGSSYKGTFLDGNLNGNGEY